MDTSITTFTMKATTIILFIVDTWLEVLYLHLSLQHSMHQQTKNCAHKQKKVRKAWHGNVHAKLHIDKWMSC